MNFIHPAFYRLWIVDDSPEDREILRYLLSRSDRQYTIREFDCAAALLRALGDSSEDGPDCILLDYHLPDDEALALLPKLGGPDALAYPIVVVTGYESNDAGRAVLRLGAQDFIGKSWLSTGSLTRCIENATERFALRCEVTEQENRFHTLFHSSGDALGLYSEGSFTDCNASLLKLFGCVAREEFLGKDPAYFSPHRQPDGRDSGELAREHIAEALRTGAHRFEWQHCRLDGVSFLADVMLTGIRVGGRPVLQACLRNITAQKEAEAEIRRLNGELESRVADRTRELAETNVNFQTTLIALDRGGIGVTWADITTARFLYVNDAAARMLGYLPDEMLHLSVLDIAPEVSPEAFARMSTRIRQEGTVRIEVEQLAKDGRSIPTEVTLCHHQAVGEQDEHYVAFVVDISERKRSEAAAREREQFIDAVVEAAGDVIVVLDRAGCIVRFNRAAEGLTGYRFQQLENHPIWDYLIPPERLADVRGVFDNLMQGRLVAEFENEWLTKSGGRRLLHWNNTVLRDEADRITHVVAVGFDVTHIRIAQRELERSEARFRALFEGAQDGILLLDPESRRFVMANPALCDLLGYRQAELLTLGIADIHPAEQLPHLIQVFDQFPCGELNPLDDIRILRKDGNERWVNITLACINGDDQQLTAALYRDVTERNQREAKLVETLRQLYDNEQALDAVGIGVHWSHCETGRTLYASSAAATILGYSQEEMLKLTITDFAMGFPFPEVAARIRAAGTMRLDITVRHKDGHDFPALVIIRYREANDDFPARFIAFVEDVTEQKQAEARLLKAKQAAEAANEAKNLFLAHMSHEIRTPLNAILGLTQLLEREPLEPGETKMVRHIQEAGDSLLHIINDILDFSKIEAGECTLDRQPFALGEILRRLRNLMSVAADAKYLQLSILEPADCPATLMGDAMRFEQVLFNLCANAIKFTQTGEIVVSVTPLAVTENEARLRIEVRDTGIGIAAEILGQLFRPFHQGDSSISRRFGGTGLGLAISRRLVELMGGRIGASSTPGKGSTFWLEVPFARVPDLAPTPVVPAEPKPGTNTAGSKPRLAGLRVLVVDDNRLNRIVAGRALQLEGAVLAEAKDGQEALDRLLEQPRGFDVVLMDIQMPIMDGLTATRHIRMTPALAELPVVALSAGVLKEEREAALEAGVNGFLPKPLELERLVEVLRPLLSYEMTDA